MISGSKFCNMFDEFLLKIWAGARYVKLEHRAAYKGGQMHLRVRVKDAILDR